MVLVNDISIVKNFININILNKAFLNRNEFKSAFNRISQY